MKTAASVAAIALVVAAYSAVHAETTSCDMSAIEGKLYANGTTGLAKCASETGVDIFAINEFPTKAEIASIVNNTGCVNYINQVTQVANTIIYSCTVDVEGQTIVFGELLADFLEGKTGNASESGSGSTISVSDSGSDSASGSESSGVDSKGAASTAGSTSNHTSSTTKSVATSTTMSSIAAGCIAVISVALML